MSNQELACPVHASDRPCMVRTDGGSYRPEQVECYQTGQWCATAAMQVPAGLSPIIPGRFKRQLAIRDQGLLPHDIDAEEAVLGSCLIDQNAIGDTGRLTPRDFYRERNGWVFDAMLKLRVKGTGINQITVGFELREAGKLDGIGGSAFLSYTISRVPTPFHVRYYADIVQTCADRRRAIENAGRKAGEAWEGKQTKREFEGFSVEP